MHTTAQRLPPFTNEPIRTFASAAEGAGLEAALARLRAAFPLQYPVVVGGRALATEHEIVSRNPFRPDEIVARVGSASQAQASEAVEVAARTFEEWKRVAPEERARCLIRAAELVRARRDEFDALLVLEVGKSWVEADADTSEAIDFLEFYAREALRYAQPPPLTPVPGEENRLTYVPLGVGIVIPPWNFAFAIMAGMTTAALVTGNTVVLKPSSDAPAIAATFVDVLREAGVPAGVVNFVPGSGRTIGDVLVAHPAARFVAFTGSKEVGLRINELAAKAQPGQRWIKRVVAEMGGKDAIVVAADADLDAAADGIVASAFGFQGQKCSACSRAIIEDAVYDALVPKLLERTRRLVVGDVAQRGVDFGPVINEAALTNILTYVETGVREGAKLLVGGSRADGPGFVVEPTILGDVAPRSTVEQQEIFGPVLALVRAESYDGALAIANDTEFGLTGAVYTGDAGKLERARVEFDVGNLYLNRKCTGALVGGHPFGGFNMSGTDSKAGGYDYLLLFLQAKVVSQRIAGSGNGKPGGE